MIWTTIRRVARLPRRHPDGRIGLWRDLQQSTEDALHEAHRQRATANEQIERLARFIADEIPGESSRSEGAVDTAIRLLKRRRGLITVSFVCEPCKSGEHEQCRGGTWCDCGHR